MNAGKNKRERLAEIKERIAARYESAAKITPSTPRRKKALNRARAYRIQAEQLRRQ